ANRIPTLVTLSGAPTVFVSAFVYEQSLLVLFGEWNSTTQRYGYRLARYKASGGLDASFSTVGAFDVVPAAPAFLPSVLALDPYGKRAVIVGANASGISMKRVWL
ncbi:MAG: hypothetical protein QM784_21855, partial [Polyangiaceae bacterium]